MLMLCRLGLSFDSISILSPQGVNEVSHNNTTNLIDPHQPLMSSYSLTSLKHRVNYRSKFGSFRDSQYGIVNLSTLHLFNFKFKAWLIE